jgi:hypothetical protein
MKKLLMSTALAALFAYSSPSQASTLWISDSSGNIGQVDTTAHDVVAGSVHNTGQALTDIAFDTSGNMFGTTLTGLYGLNPTTGASSSIGTYSGESGMTALVGASGGNLIGATSTSPNVYSINETTAGLTKISTTTPWQSAGDLAYGQNGDLYASIVFQNTFDALWDVTTGTLIGAFFVGGGALTSVFGLADDGTTMYAVDQTSVYSVNQATGALTSLFDYSLAENGQSLGNATGAAFIAVPAPVIGHGLPVVLAFGGVFLGAKLLERSRKRRSFGAAIPHATA